MTETFANVCVTCDRHNIGKRLLVKHMNVAYTTYSLHHCVVLIRVGSAVKRSRTVVFILELLQQKDDSNDSMPRGKKSDLYRQRCTIQATERGAS